MKKTINILRKLHDSSVIGKYIAYFLVAIVLIIPFSLGHILFFLTKPLIAVSHLLLGNFGTAKKEITNWRIFKDLSDW